jgi:hypothetical protein
MESNKSDQVPGTLLEADGASAIISSFRTRFCKASPPETTKRDPRMIPRPWWCDMPLAIIDMPEQIAHERYCSMGRLLYVLNQPFNRLGIAYPDQIRDFYKGRGLHEFSDWYIFDQSLNQAVVLTHDNLWAYARSLVPTDGARRMSASDFAKLSQADLRAYDAADLTPPLDLQDFAPWYEVIENLSPLHLEILAFAIGTNRTDVPELVLTQMLRACPPLTVEATIILAVLPLVDDPNGNVYDAVFRMLHPWASHPACSVINEATIRALFRYAWHPRSTPCT